ncbi:DUF47 family protein [Lysinibacter sp. HNR]|uniref:DUF47 domain-containing protein n=1 Tax=Lysinibacter sp. HNR TaxID=3031408 RepID=UPI002434C9AF|nr:DUF47 family protein [Lysinibacter sp. HNR]WGD37681.1 DUF47 family protein [Lysinibacter sp. HNR]
MFQNIFRRRKRLPKDRPKRGSKRRTIPALLIRQINFALEGAELAHRVCTKTVIDGRDKMTRIEHNGDDARSDLIEYLSGTLTTPLDREDIFRASRSIDDVLDNLRDFVRESDLWAVSLPRQAEHAVEAIGEALRHLRHGVENIRISSSQEHLRCARKEAKTVRKHYQAGLAVIFTGDFTMNTLKQREMLRRLDVVALRLIEAADAVMDGQIKRTM